jgi:hypothetical protein
MLGQRSSRRLPEQPLGMHVYILVRMYAFRCACTHFGMFVHILTCMMYTFWNACTHFGTHVHALPEILEGQCDQNLRGISDPNVSKVI